jgi:hypothetical protein
MKINYITFHSLLQRKHVKTFCLSTNGLHFILNDSSQNGLQQKTFSRLTNNNVSISSANKNVKIGVEDQYYYC